MYNAPPQDRLVANEVAEEVISFDALDLPAAESAEQEVTFLTSPKNMASDSKALSLAKFGQSKPIRVDTDFNFTDLFRGVGYLPYTNTFSEEYHLGDIFSLSNAVLRGGTLAVNALSAVNNFAPDFLREALKYTPNVVAWLESTITTFRDSDLGRIAEANDAIVAEASFGRSYVSPLDPDVTDYLKDVVAKSASIAEAVLIDDNFIIPKEYWPKLIEMSEDRIPHMYDDKEKEQWVVERINELFSELAKTAHLIGENQGREVDVVLSMNGWEHAEKNGLDVEKHIEESVDILDVQLYTSNLREKILQVEKSIIDNFELYEENLKELWITVTGRYGDTIFSSEEKEKQLELVKEFSERMGKRGLTVKVSAFDLLHYASGY